MGHKESEAKHTHKHEAGADGIEEALTEVFEDDSQVLKPRTSSGGDSVFIGMHASGSGPITYPK